MRAKSFNYPSMPILQSFPGLDCCERCGHEYGYFPDKHLPETCGSEKKECDKDDRCCKGNGRRLQYGGISFTHSRIFLFIFTHSCTERKKRFSRNIAQSKMKISRIHILLYTTRTQFDCAVSSSLTHTQFWLNTRYLGFPDLAAQGYQALVIWVITDFYLML